MTRRGTGARLLPAVYCLTLSNFLTVIRPWLANAVRTYAYLLVLKSLWIHNDFGTNARKR